MAFSTQIFGPNTGISIANRKQAASMGVKAANQGRGGDKYSIQATPFTANLLKNMGGTSSFNPETGEMEFLFGYSSFSDMFDGGGKGGSSDEGFSNKSHEEYKADNPNDNTVKSHAPAVQNNAPAADNTGSDDTPAANIPQDMGKTNKWYSDIDWLNGGGKGQSGSTYSTEGYFTPTNNYVDPYGDESETGGVNKDGMGGADGQGNAGNFISNISNTLGGNWRDGADYTDGGGVGKSGDFYVGGGLAGAVGNMMGGPRGADDQGNVATGGLDEAAMAVISSDEGKAKGLKHSQGKYVTHSNGVNFSGEVAGNFFVDGKPVDDRAAFHAGMSSGSDDDMGPMAPMNYRSQSYAGGQAGGTYDYTPMYGGMDTGNNAAAVEGINAEIASLEQQIAEISASGEGVDTSTMEAELLSLQEQLASYGLSSQDVSSYVSTLDPNSPDYNPEAYQTAFGFAMQPTYEGGVVDPSDPTAGGGGFVRRAVKDKDTGETRYVNVPINVDSGMDQFRNERRSGFGRAINSAMYV